MARSVRVTAWRSLLLGLAVACLLGPAGAVEDKCGACKIVVVSPPLYIGFVCKEEVWGQCPCFRACGLGWLDQFAESMLAFPGGCLNLLGCVTAQEPRDEGAALQQGWTLKEKAVRDISLGMPRAEEKVKQKELASYCGRLIEEHEDELVEAIKKEKFDEEAGLKELLCTKLAGVCERKTAGVPSSPDEL